MPALLLELAIVDGEGRLVREAPGRQGANLKVWGSSGCPQCFQEPADSSLSGLIAEEPGPRTEFLAGRPQGNESYRDGVGIIAAAS